jgi:hypothetical protein
MVAPRWLLHPAAPGRPQPAGSLVYELATGHPDRQAGALVFPADLTEELRAWPQERWATLGIDLDQVVATAGPGLLATRRRPRPAPAPGARRGPVGAGASALDPGPRRAAHPSGWLGRPGPAALAAPDQRPPPRRALPVARPTVARWQLCGSPSTSCAGGWTVTVHGDRSTSCPAITRHPGRAGGGTEPDSGQSRADSGHPVRGQPTHSRRDSRVLTGEPDGRRPPERTQLHPAGHR